MLETAFLKLPPGASIRIATNHDAGGWHLAGEIKAIALATGRADLALIDSQPKREGADWNDVLRETDPGPATDSALRPALRR